MYVIVVGAGDIGRPFVELATVGGNEVVVIENDEERADAIAHDFDCLVVEEDATRMETLEDAGIDRADAIVATTDRDATNIMVCLLAEEVDVPEIISVVHDPEDSAVFERIGVNVIENPSRLIAEYLYRAVKRPTITDFMRVGESAEVFEITVTENAPIAGRTLIEATQADLIGPETLVVAVERKGGGDPLTPRGDTEIHAGDDLVVYSGRGATPDVTDPFGHYEDHANAR